MSHEEKIVWKEIPKKVRILIWGVVLLGIVVSAIDLLDWFHLGYHKHTHFSLEAIPAAHSIYGFISCVVLVISATFLRRFIKRPEDYYDDPS